MNDPDYGGGTRVFMRSVVEELKEQGFRFPDWCNVDGIIFHQYLEDDDEILLYHDEDEIKIKHFVTLAAILKVSADSLCVMSNYDYIPLCFRGNLAHLFDHDNSRLEAALLKRRRAAKSEKKEIAIRKALAAGVTAEDLK